MSANQPANQPETRSANRVIRIGQGYDSHRLIAGRALILGGVTIPHPLGLDGHSDADVLLHAITDALLGALALGTIGSFFPDNDPQYRGADSRHLLRCAFRQVQQSGWRVVNLDSTILAEAPKLLPYLHLMRGHIASDLACALEQISVKAKTNEGMDSIGQQQGIAAQAVVLLEK